MGVHQREAPPKPHGNPPEALDERSLHRGRASRARRPGTARGPDNQNRGEPAPYGRDKRHVSVRITMRQPSSTIVQTKTIDRISGDQLDPNVFFGNLPT